MSRRLQIINAQRYGLAIEEALRAQLGQRIRQLEGLVAAQVERIRELEALLVQARSSTTPAAPDTLAEINASRQTSCNALRAAIAEVVAAASAPKELTAQAVRHGLERTNFTPLPALRTVRMHLAALRASGNTP